jgi:hypothetical protein
MKRLFSFFFSTILIGTVCAQCFNMTDLNDPSITCTYGYYSNPYATQGIAYNRHTINTNPLEVDYQVPQLYVIPDGESSSIRLGNDNTNAEAESITFEYVVDAENPILLLKYAAVMEDPSHASYEQPRLRLEVLDGVGNVVDPNCSSFDFVANSALGWNSMYGGSLLWKDWTTIGVDMTSYIGSKLKIRLTTYDCDQGGHFGYAYIHLSCAKKKIVSTACGNISVAKFSAPSGFEYQWYTYVGGVKTMAATTQDIEVPMDGQMYYCDISQVGKPSCYFTLSVEAAPRYPIAEFQVRKSSSCVDTIYLTNTSGVSFDGVVKNVPLEPCDSAVWDLGDGRKITTYDISQIPITYVDSGTYTVTLTAYLTDGGCQDVYSQAVTMAGTKHTHNKDIHAAICAGDVYTLGNKTYSNTGVYTQLSKTLHGCDSTTTLYLTKHPIYYSEYTEHICKGDVYEFAGYKLTETGVYIDSALSINGCDSITKLHLEVHDHYYEELFIPLCPGEAYNFAGRPIERPGVYVDSSLTIYGCDSVTKITISTNDSYLIDEYIETCHEDTFFYRGQVITKPGIYYDSLLTQHGCDSVYRLIYNKTPSYLFHSEDTMCVGATYSYRGKSYTSPGVYYDSLTTVSGCDSIYRLVLHTHPTYLIYALQTEDICADADTYEMIVQYDGTRPSHYNLRYSTKAKEQGFRDIVQAPFLNDTLHLPIPHATPYIRPDYYDVTLELINTTCPAVSTEYETQLLVRYPSWIIEQNWQDVVALKNAQYNGGYYFQSYDWHVNNVSTAQSKSYLYLPSLQVGDEVVLYATRSGEDYAIPTCPIVIEEQSIYEQAHPVPVYPTRLSRSNRNITIAAQNDEAHYYIYDSLGRSIAAGMCSASGKTVLELPNVAGYYFVMLVDAQANKQVVHVLVE